MPTPPNGISTGKGTPQPSGAGIPRRHDLLLRPERRSEPRGASASLNGGCCCRSDPMKMQHAPSPAVADCGHVPAICQSAPSDGWNGVYLVSGVDGAGPFYYVGKGDLNRAHTSKRERGGSHVQMLGVGLSDRVAHVVETSVMKAFEVAGVRAVNLVNGHGSAALKPGAALAATTAPKSGACRTLTLEEMGPGLLVPANLIHGAGAAGVRQEVYRSWSMDSALVTHSRRLLAGGMHLRLFAVASPSVVVGVYQIHAICTFPAGHRFEGGRYFTVSYDAADESLRGHYSPHHRQPGVRYLGDGQVGRAAFLALRPDAATLVPKVRARPAPDGSLF